MAAANAISRIPSLIGRLGSLPARLVGPIFTKELRVSSRRRRNFVLRSAYLAALTVFVALIWLATVKWSAYGSHAYRITHMEQAGQIIVTSVVCFQFCAVLLVTVIMLSTSISEEVYRRTLGVLMTTPINSFQVVVGKLLSKMLQLILLLAMSLPLLAVVRVLGGVPWAYVVAGLCITLTTALFFAAVTMFFSILFRRAFVSILLSLGTLAVLYLGAPLIVVLLLSAADMDSRRAVQPLLSLLVHYNPFVALGVCTGLVFEPRVPAFFGAFHWWVVCIVSLGLSAGVLAACVAMVRRVALRQAVGATGAGPTSSPETAKIAPPPVVAGLAAVSPPRPQAPPAPPPRPAQARDRIRTVTGSPIVWRELRARSLRRKLLLQIFLGIGGALLLLIYLLVAFIDNGFRDDNVHAAFICAFVVIGAMTTLVLSATSITSEKEANSWEILLCTTLSDWHILGGKMVGILRKCLPVWLLPIGHALLFMTIGLAHPILLPHLFLIVISVVGLFTGTGLYFGVRFKRTTTAVVLNLAVGLTLWAAVPLLLALATEALPRRAFRNNLRELTEYTLNANPVYQAGLVTERVTGRRAAATSLDQVRYHWDGAGYLDPAETTAHLLVCTTGYLGIGLAFAWLAKRRLRKKAF